jgi:hypothetical protein
MLGCLDINIWLQVKDFPANCPPEANFAAGWGKACFFKEKKNCREPGGKV